MCPNSVSFLIELFRNHAGESLSENDTIFTRPCLRSALHYDLYLLQLLENQIPWMVLDLLLRATLGFINSTFAVLPKDNMSKTPDHFEE